MSLFSSIQHLLPRSEAFKLTSNKWVTKLWEGLGASADDAKQEIDLVHLDLYPETTRELEEWERFYGLTPAPSENDRRLALAAEWRSTGGQSPGYIQGVLQTAGFDIYIHEWWESSGPYVARDPHDYTAYPEVGQIQCSPYTQDALLDESLPYAQLDAFLVNNPGYFDNLSLSPFAPPPIPTDPTKYPYFLYFSSESFPDPAIVLGTRIPELQRLIQKLKPSQNWIVLLVEKLVLAVVASTIENDDGIGTVWRLIFNKAMDQEWEVSTISDFSLSTDVGSVGRADATWIDATTLEISLSRVVLASEGVTSASIIAGALMDLEGNANVEFVDIATTNNSTRT